MDIRRFDEWTKHFTVRQPSRRVALRGIASAALGGLAASLSPTADAKRRRKRRRKKNTCKGGQRKCGKRCVDLATDGDNCGACGQACLSGACERGVCRCEGQTDCPLSCYCVPRQQGGGACIAAAFLGAACATDTDCSLGSICFNNRCSQPCVG